MRALLFCGLGGESQDHREKQEKRNEKSFAAPGAGGEPFLMLGTVYQGILKITLKNYEQIKRIH